MRNVINEAVNERDEISLRQENRLLMDVDAISESVICTAEYVVSLLSYGLPKSVYQLALFNLLSKHGFKLEILRTKNNVGNEADEMNEIIIVNEKLVIECMAQSESVTESQQSSMFGHENNSVAGVIVNFGAFHTEGSITRVCKDRVLH